MIVTYALSLRSGGETIVIPPYSREDSTGLLEHIREYCKLDYNKRQTFPHDYLKDLEDIIILLIHK